MVGLMNMQYAIVNGTVYVLEANPRASRTVPLVSKVCCISMVLIATVVITKELTGRLSLVPGAEAAAHTVFRNKGGDVPVFHVPGDGFGP